MNTFSSGLQQHRTKFEKFRFYSIITRGQLKLYLFDKTTPGLVLARQKNKFNFKLRQNRKKN